MATNKTVRDDPWETQAKGHEGHIRVVVDGGNNWKVIKCNCGQEIVERTDSATD